MRPYQFVCWPVRSDLAGFLAVGTHPIGLPAIPVWFVIFVISGPRGLATVCLGGVFHGV